MTNEDSELRLLIGWYKHEHLIGKARQMAPEQVNADIMEKLTESGNLKELEFLTGLMKGQDHDNRGISGI